MVGAVYIVNIFMSMQIRYWNNYCASNIGATVDQSWHDNVVNVFLFFFNTIFVSSHMYPENRKGTQVIVGSMNIGYISDTARNRTHNLFRPKWELIPLGMSIQILG